MSSIHNNAILLGIIGGAGIALLAAAFIPGRPALKQAIAHLSGNSVDAAPRTSDDDTFKYRVGARAQPWILAHDWIKIPTSDLKVLRVSVPRFLGDKILSALVGLLFVPFASLLLAFAGYQLPWSVPAAASVFLCAVLFFASDLQVRKDAATARAEFAEHLQAYIELVTLNRTAAVGAVQSLERAAAVGDSWVFQRINEELQKAALAGKAPWQALKQISLELELPELTDLADIMTLSGEHGTSIVETLRARSRSLRNEILTTELGEATAASERLKIPGALIAVTLVIMLAVPAVTNVMNT